MRLNLAEAGKLKKRIVHSVTKLNLFVTPLEAFDESRITGALGYGSMTLFPPCKDKVQQLWRF
jgi:hypothetical protein